MAEASKTATRAPHVTVTGKLASKRRTVIRGQQATVYTVKLAALDEFTAPATLEVIAYMDCGAVGDVVELRCALSGYGRSYKTTDPQSGRDVTVPTADNVLTVV